MSQRLSTTIPDQRNKRWIKLIDKMFNHSAKTKNRLHRDSLWGMKWPQAVIGPIQKRRTIYEVYSFFGVEHLGIIIFFHHLFYPT